MMVATMKKQRKKPESRVRFNFHPLSQFRERAESPFREKQELLFSPLFFPLFIFPVAHYMNHGNFKVSLRPDSKSFYSGAWIILPAAASPSLQGYILSPSLQKVLLNGGSGYYLFRGIKWWKEGDRRLPFSRGLAYSKMYEADKKPPIFLFQIREGLRWSN